MSSSPASRKASTTPDLGSPPTKKESDVEFKKWFPRDDEPRTLEELRGLTSEQLADPELGPTLDEYRMLWSRVGTKWTDEETGALYQWRLASQCVPYIEIGRRLQRSDLACRLRINNLRDGKVKGFEHYDMTRLANGSGRRGPRGGAGVVKSRRTVSASRQRRRNRNVASAPPTTQPGPSQPQPVQFSMPSAMLSGFRPINQPGQNNADPTETAQLLLSFSQGAVKRSSQDEISTALAINKAARSDTPQQRPEDISEPTSPHTGAAEPDATPQWPPMLTFNQSARDSSSPEFTRSPAATEAKPKEDSSALGSKPVSERMSFARIMN
ncbi:hypothetical protein HII31_08219 [Pseudocercospora fuligena]|uniref:Myb-like domain-containing protein n=1 Tax=Pseudocercospora fuligena TaxID=685502 RepID=A0A8H6VKX8_9PEZI|nr:hypothetical protein HII31_08219 [Pseudocercospora fuligena]